MADALAQTVLTEWLQDLESGNIRQVSGHMGETDGGRCCMGVLCDVALRHGVVRGLHVSNEFPTELRWDGNTSFPPDPVADLLNPLEELFDAWIDMNDGTSSGEPKTFAQIAESIRVEARKAGFDA